MATRLRVVAVGPEKVRDIRARILRPEQPPEATVYPGDDDDDTVHFGAFVDDVLVGIASLYRQPPPLEDDDNAWRVRGMAVVPEARGGGHGVALLRACVEHVRAHEGTYIWCNARTNAVGFYGREGFSTEGDEFDVPGIGPHYFMARRLR